MIVGWIFMVFIRKRYLPWWVKYNYVLTSALDCGVAIAAIVSTGEVIRELDLIHVGNFR